jgi:plasmid stabilization system protein ParE
MASLLYTERALEDLRRLAEFLANDDVAAAIATGDLVVKALEVLEAHPLIGRRVNGELRELVISRGKSGYLALYEYQSVFDRVLVHAIRHQREAGFEE